MQYIQQAWTTLGVRWSEFVDTAKEQNLLVYPTVLAGFIAKWTRLKLHLFEKATSRNK